MTSTIGNSAETAETDSEATDLGAIRLDAVILGAGVAGLYQLHQLRTQGLQVLAIDSASDVGGTWF